MSLNGWDGSIHPAADLFPMMADAELASLVESIRRDGLREAVWLTADGALLDGRNRVRACDLAGVQPIFRTYHGDDPVAFVMALNMERRHLTVGQRAMLANEILPMYEAEADQRKKAGVKGNPSADLHEGGLRERRSDVRAGAAAKVSGRAVSQAKRLAEKAPDLAEKVRNGELALDKADKMLTRRLKEEQRAESIARSTGMTFANFDLRVGDFRQCLSDLHDVDAIITDPPYPQEFLPLLSDLATWAPSVLKPSGLLAVMIGQSYLPDVYARLNGELPYLWTMAYLTPGGQAVQIWDRHVNTFWKPILLYGSAADWFGDVAKSATNDNDKQHHHWGQSVSGMLDLVKRLVPAGSHIVDPFMGAGTTAVAAMRHGCTFSGCDIDGQYVDITRARLAEEVQS